MVVERALAVGSGSASEVERPQPAGNLERRADHLDHARLDALGQVADFAGERGDVRGLVVERAEAGADEEGLQRRQITLQIDDALEITVRIDAVERLEHAIGTGRVVGARQYRLATRGAHCLGDRVGVGRDHDAAEFGGHGAAPDVHDHRLAMDIGHGLIGQTCRAHAGGDDGQDALHVRSTRVRWVGRVTIGLGDP